MAKKRPQTSGKALPPAPTNAAGQKSRWYSRVWVVLSFAGAALFGLLANGPALIANAEKLPGDIARVSGNFLSWYFEDGDWDGLWSAHPEGYIDMEEMNLSDTDVKLHLQVEGGSIGGEIAMKSICRATPLLDYFLLDGRVNKFDAGTAKIVAFDFIGGRRRVFFTLTVKRQGVVMTVSEDGPPQWLRAPVRIALNPLDKDDDPYKQLTGACSAEREEFLKTIRPPNLRPGVRAPLGN